jgi:hypothetical protein
MEGAGADCLGGVAASTEERASKPVALKTWQHGKPPKEDTSFQEFDAGRRRLIGPSTARDDAAFTKREVIAPGAKQIPHSAAGVFGNLSGFAGPVALLQQCSIRAIEHASNRIFVRWYRGPHVCGRVHGPP